METNKVLEILRNPEENIIRIAIISILMLTTIMSVERRWMECEVWIFFGIPVLLLVGFAMLIRKTHRFDCTLTDIIISIWFVYYVGRTWIGNEWPCKMEFLKTTELFLLYVGLRIAFNKTNISQWVLIGSILVFGCYEACFGASQLYGNSTSRHSLFALTGNFQNPGPYSAYLMVGVVTGLASLKKIEGIWKYVVTTAIVIMAIMLPATWSRSAFLGIVVVALIIYREKYWKYRYLIWGAILVSAIAFYLIKQGSADGRLAIWKAALTTWTYYPCLGVGIGGFYHAFAEGMTQLSTSNMDFSSINVPDGAYNILLKIVVEQGVLGGIMAVLLVMSVLLVLYKNSEPLFWGIIALLLFAMFSYPFDLLPYKVITVLIVAWSESKHGKKVFEIGCITIVLLSCFFGFASWQAGRIADNSYMIEKEGYKLSGFSDFYSFEEGYKWLASENDNHEFLFAFGKRLREEGRFNESNAVLRQGTKCSADPMFYVLIGNNYKDMKHYDLAEQTYYKAFSMMPNRLYPLFQLMMLYHDSGNHQKAKTMAKRVIEMKPKVESPATRDMKKKAMNII